MQSCSRRSFLASSSALLISAGLSQGRLFAKPQLPSGTGYCYHPDFARFENTYSEVPARAQWINSRLILSGVTGDTTAMTPIVEDPMQYIKLVHNQEHIDSIKGQTSSTVKYPLSESEGAHLAVSYILGTVKQVCEGTVRNAFCAIRPPGHHVQNSGESGYCHYANVVIAAHYARQNYNIKKILIVDWDYHQGNGTHGHICGDNNILFFETLNPDMYTTDCDDYFPIGPQASIADDARRINIRMPFGATGDDFVRVFESKLFPAAERFKPELVLISCGFDLKKFDSHNHAGFTVTANTLSRLTRIVKQIADTYAGGKLVSMLEGGYSDSPRDSTIYGNGATFSGLSQCAENHVKTLLTGDEQPETPYYSQSTSIAIGDRKLHSGGVFIRNGVLLGIPHEFGLFDLTITLPNGRIAIKQNNLNVTTVNLNEYNLAKGQYIVSLCGKSKTIVKYCMY